MYDPGVRLRQVQLLNQETAGHMRCLVAKGLLRGGALHIWTVPC